MRPFTTLVLATSLLFAAGSATAQPEPDPGAARAFAELVKRHRAMPSVEIRSTLTISLKRGETASEGEEVKATFIRRKDGEGLIKVRDYTFHLQDGKIIATHASNEDEYFEIEDGDYVHGTLVYTCFQAFDRIPFPSLAILWGSKEMEFLYMELYADTPDLTPQKLMDRVVDGETVRTIVFESENATLDLNFDPRTYHLRSMRHEITGGYLVQPGTTRINEYDLEYTSDDKPIPDEKIVFAQGDRQRTDFINTLVKQDPATIEPQPDPGPGPGAPVQPGIVGQVAPGFILPDASGELVDLEKLRGSVVVLDFWATWCGPCREALPELHNVAKWAKEKNLPVRILAVNAWENGETLEQKTEAALDFWSDAGHSLPIIMDHENAAAEAYGVSGIPSTFVIGPDGIVRNAHVGYRPGYSETLKEEIRKALEM